MINCSVDKQSLFINKINDKNLSEIKKIAQDIFPGLNIEFLIQNFTDDNKIKLINTLDFLGYNNLSESDKLKLNSISNNYKKINNIESFFKNSDVNKLFFGTPTLKNKFEKETNSMIMNAILFNTIIKDKNGNPISKKYVGKDLSILNKNIRELKNELFKDISNHLFDLNLLSDDIISILFDNGLFKGNLYDLNGSFNKDIYETYKKIINISNSYYFENANRKFISNNNIKIPVLNANSKSNSDKKDISNYIKTVFLVNFDNIIKNKFDNLIKIDPFVFNDFDVSVNRAKYSFLFQGDFTEYWLEDDHMSEDASRVETDLTKQIIGSIPRKSIINYTPLSTSLEDNGFLSINDVYGLGAMINSIELESLNYLSTLSGWEPFANNPVKMLNWYLNKIKDDYDSNKDILIPDVKTNTISDNLRNTSSFFKRKFDVFLSIKSFLDQLTEQEKNSDNLISTIISHVMINTYGANYGNYNVEDGSLTTLELHSHNADAVSIQNSIYSHLYTKTSLPNTFNIIVKGNVLNYSEEKSYLEKELNNSGFLSKFIESKLGIYLPISSEDKLKRLKKWSDKNGNISNSVIAENLIGILNNIRTAGADNKNLLQKIISHEVELEEKSFGQYAAKSDIISPLTKNGHVQDIIDLALELLPTTPITTVEKSTGDKIPTFKLHNLMYDDVKLLHDRKLFELNNPNTKYKNLLLSTSSILGTLTKLELQGVSSKDASKWNASENFDSNFLYDFLYSLHPDSKMPGINIIIGAYSDKSTILSKLINKNVIHNDKRLIQGENVESIKGLKTIYRFQMNDYYKDLLNYITESYKFIPEISNKLNSDISNNISVINDFLSSFNSKNELLSRLKEITLSNPNVEFIEEVHYSLYLNDLDKSVMNLNKSILHSYNTSLNESAFNEFYNSELDKLVNDLSEYKNNILISNTHISKWNKLFTSDNIIDDFYKLLGLSNPEKFNSKEGILIKNESNEINPLLEKWFLLNNLFRSEYQNLSAKSDYVHSAKKIKLLGDINLEFDGRFKNASKRNVQYISTTEVSNKGLQKGLPNSLNFAVIQDAIDYLHSPVQESHKQDIHDGSSFMTYVTSKMLEESYKGKGYSGTKKQFGVFLTTYSSAVKKDAEFIITNNKMLKSLKGETSLYNINKKALSAIEINQKINNPDSKISTNFIKNGKKYTISDIKFTYENGVNKMVYFLKENNNKPFITSSEVKTLFDIWEILGGIYTTDKTFKNFTEDSNEALYELITSKNNDFLKSSFIHVISNQSAFKSGAANVNLSDSWKNKDDKLSYFTRDISFYGPQLDAKHEADASKIKEITQIISAASQNYKTAHIAMEMYEDLANIINKAIKPYEDAIKGDNKDFGKYIASKLISSVSNDDRGDIVVALSNILGLENLPFSEQTFFPHLVRNLISKMNSDFITRKYPGLGAVLNPSHKIIQIYEDSLGNVYTMDSLVKKALLNNTEEGLTNEQIVDNYINNYFKDESTTIDKVFIGQKIKVIDEQNNITIVDLNSPLKYIEFKEAYENDSSKSIYIMRNVPRDLKPEETSFDYEGKQMNLFDLDSVILRAALENYINISKSNLISEVKTELPINNWKYKSLEQFSQLMGLEFNLLNENTISKLFDLLKKWTQRNLDFIEENKLIKRIDKSNPVVKDVLTLSNGVIDNFELRFREVNKLYNVVPITNYTFKQAELIGGNIYNSLFNIGSDDVSDIKNDPNYFLNKINDLLILDERQADFKITTDEQNTTVYVKIVNELPPYKKYSNVVKNPEIFGDEFQNNIVRLNDKGEPLYVLPKNSVVELKDGVDVVYIKLGEFNKKENKTKIKPGELRNLTNFVKSFSTINSFLPILNNSIDLDFLNDKGEIVNVRNVIGNEFRKIYNLPVMTDNFTKEFFENKLPEIKNSIANKQLASWEKSLEFLVARIPSQSTQSFMPMKTVGYLGANSNDVYVSVYQLMIQGSDLDIDKAYLMGYSFNKAGKYEIWTDNLDYNNKEELDQLEKLPMPSNKMIITDNLGIDLSSYDLEFETLLNSDKFDSGTLKSENSKIYIEQIKLLKVVLNLLKESNYKTNLSSNSNLFKFINNYNASKNYLKIKGALNNSIVSKLQQIISTPSVRILANTPVEVESIRTAGKNASKNKIDKLMSPYSTLSYLEQTEEAAVGKDDVGVGANGSKVFYALSNYYNNTLKNIIFNSNEEYVTHPAVFSKNIQIEDKNYNIGSVSDIDLSESFIRTTIDFYGEQIFDRKLTLLESNAALAISGFISGATDNAKELVMAKINATVTLAKIHLYMLSLGIPIDDVAIFMKSPTVELIIANLKTNLVNNESFKSVEKVVSDILNEDKSLERELNQFLSVYNGAIEFSNMASIFGVNQKMAANVGEIFKFFNKIETSLFTREKTLFTKNVNKLKLENKSDETFVFNVILKNNVLYNSYYNKLESNEKEAFKNKILNIVKEAYTLGIAGGSFSAENYLSEDENYKNVTVQYYNLIKDTFNIFDVINKSPHYSAMLKGVYTTNNTLKYLSKKYKFVFEDVKKIANDSNIKVALKNNNSGVISNMLNSSSFPIAYNDDTIPRASALYDKLVISNWLKKENPFIINVNNLLRQANIDKIDLYESDEAKYYPEKVAKKLKGVIKTVSVNDSEDTLLYLTSDHDLANFRLLVEQIMLPILKESKNSDLGKYLILSTVKNSLGGFSPQLISKFPLSNLNNPYNGAKFSEILYHFNLVDEKIELENKIKSSDGKILQWKDILYLYNLIVNNGASGNKRLTSLFINYSQTNDSLAVKYAKYYKDIDNGNENISDNLSKDLVLYWVFNKRGNLNVPVINDKNELEIKSVFIKNPNFTILSSIDQSKQLIKDNLEKANKILSNILSKNLIINYNCD